MMASLKEFKPTILFLVKFIGLYVVGSLLYGFYVTYYHPKPDPVTHVVSCQVAALLSAGGFETHVQDSEKKPTTLLVYDKRSIVGVYEGCNGLNTMIIFMAFVMAFGPAQKKMIWFIPLGLLIIHFANLTRIVLLFFVSEFKPHLVYFTHKYLFTAVLYVVIFLLWMWWVKCFQNRHE